MRHPHEPYDLKTRLIVGLIFGAIAGIIYGIIELWKWLF
jgi:hypothetical protein